MGNANVNETYGLRICKILENSPANGTDLQIYSDFIIDILEKPNKFNLENDFYKFIIENENKTIHFKVYSLLMLPIQNQNVQPGFQDKACVIFHPFQIREDKQ